MSQSERGGSSTSHPKGPDVGRPSLFADLADHPHHDSPGSPPAVRILSTLESPQSPPRRVRGAGRPNGGAASRRGRWWLWSLLVLGLLATGLGLSLSRLDAAALPPETMAKVVAPTAQSPATPQPTTSQASPFIAPIEAAPAASSPVAALIENAPPPPTAGSAPTVATALAATTAVAVAMQAADTPVTSTSNPKDAAAPRPMAQPAHPAKASRSAAAKTANAKRRKAADDDVALLEAMFTHSGRRAAPRSAATELQRRCGPLDGAEARQCRVRVCKAYPQARVCQ